MAAWSILDGNDGAKNNDMMTVVMMITHLSITMTPRPILDGNDGAKE